MTNSGSLKRKKAKNNVGRPCVYCGRQMIAASAIINEDHQMKGLVATIEHITPQGEGGSNEPYNLTIACARCNNIRGSLHYDIFVQFARTVIRQYPDAPTVVLRQSLHQFVTSLAEIAIRNKRETNRALSLSLLKLGNIMEK